MAYVYESGRYSKSCCFCTRGEKADEHARGETHTGMLKSWEHLLLYNQIELAITESKTQNKTSGAVSSRGYKSEREREEGDMKMSQSEILKDSVSDWPINVPGVSKRTWGNGRNGTEQRALEGIWNTSEWRGRGESAGEGR